MDKIEELIIALQAIILAAGTLRIIQYMVSIAISPDEAQSYKKRIKNILGYCVLSVCVSSIIIIIKSYLT